jgi:putative ABC transport system substrate-binding protein
MTRQLKRREFITLIAGAAAVSLTGTTVHAEGARLVGVLDAAPNAANFSALKTGLRDLGYREGQSVRFEHRSADGRNERFPALAAELVRLKVDVIVTRTTTATVAAMKATGTIPIVMAATSEPLGIVVARLARPGGNVTGLSAYATALLGKRVGLLKEVVPGLSRLAAIHNLENPNGPPQWEEVRSAAASLAIAPILLDVRSAEGFAPALTSAVAQSIDGVVVAPLAAAQANRAMLAALLARHKLPAIYGDREFVEAGGLMSYGVSYADLYRRAAIYVDKIFKGAKPAELPVEQPTRFELVFNLKAAKALNLTIPESFLLRADEVIE